MKYVTMMILLLSCLVFQGCVHHHARPHAAYDEPQVVHHVVTPPPAPRHDVRHAPAPHHPAPKPHAVHARPAPKPQAVHTRPNHSPQAHHSAPAARKPEPRLHSGNRYGDNRHFSQPRHRNQLLH